MNGFLKKTAIAGASALTIAAGVAAVPTPPTRSAAVTVVAAVATSVAAASVAVTSVVVASAGGAASAAAASVVVALAVAASGVVTVAATAAVTGVATVVTAAVTATVAVTATATVVATADTAMVSARACCSVRSPDTATAIAVTAGSTAAMATATAAVGTVAMVVTAATASATEPTFVERGPASAGPFSMAAPLVLAGLHGRGVEPIDLRIEPGEAVAILGPSGAGKSLLLRLVADLDPGGGDVRLGDQARGAMAAPEWRRRVTLVPAEPGWWAPGVAAHFPSHGATVDVARLGLPSDVMRRAVAGLSTGERQRLALLRALARTPDVLLLDEPTSALDPASTAAVIDLLRETLAAGLAVIVVTHDVGVAERLGVRRYTMAAGRLAIAESA